MATSLAEIRAKLLAQDQKSSGNASFGESAIFPHWNIAEGASCTLRFLPDKDPNNTFFWVERNLIRLPFSGIKGDPASSPVIVQVPCMEMWGETCPILAEVRPWYKDESLKLMANKYWKKRSYLFQGFVHNNPITDDIMPANPIRRFIISSQIFNLVKAALIDPDMMDLPTDYTAGLDFRVNKTTKGEYADYNTSAWARKESALTAAELAAINEHGLFDLKEFLPKKPGPVELGIMKEMFEASVDGQAYDADKWGQYFKYIGAPRDTPPATTDSPALSAAGRANAAAFDADVTIAESSVVAPPVVTPPVVTPPVVTPPAAEATSPNAASEILARIRSRNNSD